MNVVPKAKATTATSSHHQTETTRVIGPPTDDQAAPTKRAEDDIFLAAQYGDWQGIERLIKDGTARATETNEQGITPLHWAAINDRLLACKTLVDHGADVNAIGGDLNATPMMWAAKNGHVYIVHYLMTRGGDPAMVDSQGYNVLQLATHSSNILLLIYLLHIDMPVDSVDPQQHTCLMWAAYQGDALSVDTLLKWGGNVNGKDEDGLNALHWSIVRGNKQCIKRIIEEGGDLSAKQNEGKDAQALAKELKTVKAFEGALASVGRDVETGLCKAHWFSTALSMKIIFLLPSVSLGLCLELLSVAPIMISLPIMAITLFLFHKLSTSFVLPPGLRTAGVHRTPYLAGVFFASCVWTTIHWIAVILPSIGWVWPSLNLLFGVVFAFALYNFFRAMSSDPGFLPTTGSRAEQRESIEELLREGEFDNQHFCVTCMLRKPLRGKHCKICQRCVARHDHHCPWVNNCVGVRNHRSFILYVYALFLGIPMLAVLEHLHIKHLGAPRSPVPCTLLAEEYCTWIQIDTFGLILTLWDCLQMTWISMLVVVQSWQIAKARTTQEVVNVRKHGHMGGARDARRTSHAAQVASVISGGTTNPESTALESDAEVRHAHPHAHVERVSGGIMRTVTRLLGIDQFVDTAREGLTRTRGRRHRRRFENPFDGGVKSNCVDFWHGGGEGGTGRARGQEVDFYRLYTVPSSATEMYAPVSIEEEV